MISVWEMVWFIFIDYVANITLMCIYTGSVQLILRVRSFQQFPFDLGRDLDILCVNYDTCKVFFYSSRRIFYIWYL